MKKLKKAVPHIVFLGPAFVLFSLAVIIPFAVSIYYSLTDWNGISSSSNFVGFKNYIAIFSGKTQFLTAAKFTVWIGLVIVVLTNLLGIALAALLEKKFRGI